jgi:hypothetical protein
MPRNLLAQIKMGETIAILVIFFFLIVFGFSFYVKMQKVGFGRQTKENLDMRSIQVAQKATFLPELMRSKDNVQSDDCIDLLKLTAFSNMLKNEDGEYHKYYSNTFGASTLRVDQVYPAEKSFLIYEQIPDGKFDVLVTRIPITLYNATADSYAFGVLTVTIYG